VTKRLFPNPRLKDTLRLAEGLPDTYQVDISQWVKIRKYFPQKSWVPQLSGEGTFQEHQIAGHVFHPGENNLVTAGRKGQPSADQTW